MHMQMQQFAYHTKQDSVINHLVDSRNSDLKFVPNCKQDKFQSYAYRPRIIQFELRLVLKPHPGGYHNECMSMYRRLLCSVVAATHGE